MKSKIGIVISKDTSHSKVKIIDNKHKNKIIEVATVEDITVGEKVYIEFKSTLKLKLIYIKYIQPIIFAILGLKLGEYIGKLLNQPDVVYKYVFTCLFITIALIYKDYISEKSKFSSKYLHSIKKIK